MHPQVVKIQVNSNHGPRGKDWATMEPEVCNLLQSSSQKRIGQKSYNLC